MPVEQRDAGRLRREGPDLGRPLRTSAAFPAKPAEDTPAPWGWVDPAVWTERMLGALKTGVQGGKWYSVMDNVAHAATLLINAGPMLFSRPSGCIP